MQARVVLAVAAVALGGLPASVPAAASEGSAGPALRVGVVAGGPGGGEEGYDALLVAGLRRAMRELGVTARVLTPSLREGYLPSLLYLARRHYDLVIAASATEAEAVDRAAVTYPRVRFAVLDFPNEALAHRPSNVLGVTFAAEQAGYLAGYLAGLMERRRPGRDVVSSVGGLKAPPVDAYIAGFQAGARTADPGVTSLHTYVRSFFDPARCRSAALTQIAKGSGAVFQVAGHCGLGVLQAAKEKGVWGIGADVDQSSQGPQVLTSAVKRVDVAVYAVVRRVLQGHFRGGRTAVFDLRHDGVGLGRISPRVPRAFVARVERVERQMASGKIRNIPTTVP